MKKIYLLCLCLFCLLLVGCSNGETKNVGSLDTFQTSCTNNGYTCIDRLPSYQADGITYITGSIEGTYEGSTLEMVIYDTVENATKIQDQQISSFNKLKGTAATVKNDKGDNYRKYTMITNGYYMVSSRVENTLIFTYRQ